MGAQLRTPKNTIEYYNGPRGFRAARNPLHGWQETPFPRTAVQVFTCLLFQPSHSSSVYFRLWFARVTQHKNPHRQKLEQMKPPPQTPRCTTLLFEGFQEVLSIGRRTSLGRLYAWWLLFFLLMKKKCNFCCPFWEGSAGKSRVACGRSVHSEKYIYVFFQTERNVIIATVSLLFMNQTDFCLVHSEKENGHEIIFRSIWKEMEIYFFCYPFQFTFISNGI